jgi:thiamine monophosphate kinase
MRNVDLEMSLLESELHTEIQRKSEALRLISLAVRCNGESIHEYFGEDYELLSALPISLVTMISARAENYKLIKVLKVDENEDLFITLHKPACKQLVGEIIEHIIENEEHYFRMFSDETSRESCFVTFD